MARNLKKLLQAARREYLPLPASSRRAITEPTDLVVAFVEAWDEGDAEAIGDLFAEDADFVNVVGLWWTSRRSIVKAHRYGFERIFADATMTLLEVRERRVGNSAAVVTARWQLTGQRDPAGERAGTRTGVMSVTAVRLEDGTWLGVHAQNTDVAVSADTNVAHDGRLVATSYLEGPSAEAIAAADFADD